MKHAKRTNVQTEEQSFYNGSIEHGLSGGMGDIWSDALAFVNKAITPAAAAPTLPAAPLAVAAKPNMTMTYVKYGGMAVGGLVGLMLVMKMLKGRA
jgi:hypothetical protein